MMPEEMAEHWYGYGRWDAPYWFVGVEPGGDKLEESAQRWRELGRGELLDIVAHLEGLYVKQFDERAKTQPTWGKLIWLLLATKARSQLAMQR
jgi:hypothetical protein